MVLTGVEDRPEKIEQAVRHARAVDGVVVVKSFMQVKAREPVPASWAPVPAV